MLSKVATTLGLSSASMAVSESEFSISSSSKSASPARVSVPSPSSPLPRSGAGLHGVVRALGRLPCLGFGRDLLLDLDRLAALALGLLLGLLELLLSLFVGFLSLHNVDAHLAEHREYILDLLRIDLFRQRVNLLMG